MGIIVVAVAKMVTRTGKAFNNGGNVGNNTIHELDSDDEAENLEFDRKHQKNGRG